MLAAPISILLNPQKGQSALANGGSGAQLPILRRLDGGGRMAKVRVKNLALGLAGLLLSGYLGVCGYLFVRQRQVIYYPTPMLYSNPGAAEYGIPYEDVKIPVGTPIGSQTLAGWWLPAPTPDEPLDGLPGEPQRILKRPQVVLYLCGVGPNMGAPNYLTRIKALRQLGFAVLIFDYRGYGRTGGEFPNEQRIYEDADAAWAYLTQTRQVAARDILIYGESLGARWGLSWRSGSRGPMVSWCRVVLRGWRM
jgi:uncharacterized protein